MRSEVRMGSQCPNEFKRLLWMLDELPESETAQVGAHMDTCPRCTADLHALRDVATALQVPPNAADETGGSCLDEAELGAWVDGTLEDAAAATTLSHLAICARCRRAAASLVYALQSEPIAAALNEIEGARRTRSPRHSIARRVMTAAPLAAAAAVAGFLLIRSIDVDVGREPVERESTSGVMSAPNLQSPIGEVPALGQFTWSVAGPGDMFDAYRITVYDEQGVVLWELETGDTGVAPPATVRFEPGV